MLESVSSQLITRENPSTTEPKTSAVYSGILYFYTIELLTFDASTIKTIRIQFLIPQIKGEITTSRMAHLKNLAQISKFIAG